MEMEDKDKSTEQTKNSLFLFKWFTIHELINEENDGDVTFCVNYISNNFEISQTFPRDNNELLL